MKPLKETFQEMQKRLFEIGIQCLKYPEPLNLLTLYRYKAGYHLCKLKMVKELGVAETIERASTELRGAIHKLAEARKKYRPLLNPRTRQLSLKLT